MRSVRASDAMTYSVHRIAAAISREPHASTATVAHPRGNSSERGTGVRLHVVLAGSSGRHVSINWRISTEPIAHPARPSRTSPKCSSSTVARCWLGSEARSVFEVAAWFTRGRRSPHSQPPHLRGGHRPPKHGDRPPWLQQRRCTRPRFAHDEPPGSDLLHQLRHGPFGALSQPLDHPRSVGVRLQSSDDPRPRVAQGAVVQIHRVLRGEQHAHAEGALVSS